MSRLTSFFVRVLGVGALCSWAGSSRGLQDPSETNPEKIHLVRTPTDVLWSWIRTHPWETLGIVLLLWAVVAVLLTRRQRRGLFRFPTSREVGDWLRRRSLILTTLVLMFLMVVLFFADRTFVSVYSGQSGVLWSRFFGGTQIDRVYLEGLHIIFPWDEMNIYDIRLQENQREFQVLSSDGLEMRVSVSVRFRPIQAHLGVLHREVGPQYVETLVLPELGAQARKQIALYEPFELYSQLREDVQQEMTEGLRRQIRVMYRQGAPPEDAIHVEDVLIRNIQLPDQVRNAIEKKLTQRHMMLEYSYRIEKEEMEKARKKIEAEGIRTFQDIVNEGISERYLRWKGIDATLELARSTNSKVVVIGGGEDGLPIILGNVDGAAPEPPPVAGAGTVSRGSTLSSTPVGDVASETPVGAAQLGPDTRPRRQ